MKSSLVSESTVIAVQNDNLRRFHHNGLVVISRGIAALDRRLWAEIIAEVATFDAFTPDNDPYGEHNCALVNVRGLRVIFKIDYYDPTLLHHSDDPTNPEITRRVMTSLPRSPRYQSSAHSLALERLSSFVLTRWFLPARYVEHCQSGLPGRLYRWTLPPRTRASRSSSHPSRSCISVQGMCNSMSGIGRSKLVRKMLISLKKWCQGRNRTTDTRIFS